MGLQVHRTGKEDYSRYIKALIVGMAGAGKTLSSSTWKNPLIASAEAGLMSIADRNVPYVDVRSSETLFQLKIVLDQDPETREKYLGFPVDTIVIDTIDEVQKILIRERLEESKKEAMELRDWGWLGEQMRAMIRGFRNLDLNVVMNVHMKESSDSESGRLFFAPALQGAVGDELPNFVDLALLLKAAPTTVIVDGENKRVMARHLQTYPDPQHAWIKDRSGKLPPEFDINFEDDYQRLFDTIYGSVDLPTTEVVDVGHVKTSVNVSAAEPAPTGRQIPSAASEAKTVEAKPLEEAAKPKATTVPPDLKLVEQALVQDPPAKKPPKVAKASVPADAVKCEECGGEIESEDQLDISKIRFRKAYCQACFRAAKTNSKASR